MDPLHQLTKPLAEASGGAAVRVKTDLLRVLAARTKKLSPVFPVGAQVLARMLADPEPEAEQPLSEMWVDLTEPPGPPRPEPDMTSDLSPEIMETIKQVLLQRKLAQEAAARVFPLDPSVFPGLSTRKPATVNMAAVPQNQTDLQKFLADTFRFARMNPEQAEAEARRWRQQRGLPVLP